MKLQPWETELIGAWEIRDGQMAADETETRVADLIANDLQEVGDENWRRLFVAPSTGDYWELTYPRGETNGGGAMKLARLSADEAQRKYGV